MSFIVTGAASGIGHAVATTLARRQVNLTLVDMDKDRLEAAVTEVRRLGALAIAITIDLSSIDAPAHIVDETFKAYGQIDGIASNAGGNFRGDLKTLSLESYERSFAINTRPTWLLGKAAHPHLARSRGAIVATASTASEHANPPGGSYAASKAALVALVQQMAIEWGQDGIRCNCVSPGLTLTPMLTARFDNISQIERRSRVVPVRRIGDPQEIANAIVFLLSPDSSYISGVNLMVDGGLTSNLMPLAAQIAD
jgi:NAD(P)-dependent dehydrogenase (short-subunit alcohol dehydrogenase family)